MRLEALKAIASLPYRRPRPQYGVLRRRARWSTSILPSCRSASRDPFRGLRLADSVTPHALRHSFATSLLGSRRRSQEIQELLATLRCRRPSATPNVDSARLTAVYRAAIRGESALAEAEPQPATDLADALLHDGRIECSTAPPTKNRGMGRGPPYRGRLRDRPSAPPAPAAGAGPAGPCCLCPVTPSVSWPAFRSPSTMDLVRPSASPMRKPAP